MAIGPDDPELLGSDDYAEVAHLITAKITEILASDKERNFLPPYELHITGADDNLVCYALYEADEEGGIKIRNLEPGASALKLTARFPVTAMLAIKAGNVLEMIITPSMIPRA